MGNWVGRCISVAGCVVMTPISFITFLFCLPGAPEMPSLNLFLVEHPFLPPSNLWARLSSQYNLILPQSCEYCHTVVRRICLGSPLDFYCCVFLPYVKLNAVPHFQMNKNRSSRGNCVVST